MTDDLRRKKLANEARRWLDDGCLILDTETTGLDGDAEIVEISIIDATGATLLDTLIRPTRPIPEEVTRIHGIHDADVLHAPTWSDVYPEFRRITQNRLIVIYNADYDERIISQTSDLNSIDDQLRIDSGFVVLINSTNKVTVELG